MAKKNETPVVENEEMKQKFQVKLVELLALGKKKKNMLEYQEISDHFKDMPLEPEKMELILDYLDHNGEDVLRLWCIHHACRSKFFRYRKASQASWRTYPSRTPCSKWLLPHEHEDDLLHNSHGDNAHCQMHGPDASSEAYRSWSSCYHPKSYVQSHTGRRNTRYLR